MKHLHIIRQHIDAHGSLTGFAIMLGISSSFLSDVMKGNRPVSLRLALQLEAKCGINGLRLLSQQVEYEWLEYKKQGGKL